MPPVSAKDSKTVLLLIDIQNAFHVPNFFGGQRNNDQLEENVGNLLESTRRWNERQWNSADQQQGNGSIRERVRIIHVHHRSENPTSPLHPSYIMPLGVTGSSEYTQDGDKQQQQDQQIRGIDPMPCAEPGSDEPVVTKQVNSAFIGTTLARWLRDIPVRQLLIFGITTDHCVSTSVRMAANLQVVDSPDGKEQGKIWLVEDACATFPRGEYPADLVHKLHIESLRDEFAGITTVEEVLKHVLAE